MFWKLYVRHRVCENAEILIVTSGALRMYINWRLKFKGLHIEKYLSINLLFSTEFPNTLSYQYKGHICIHAYSFSSCCIVTVSIGLLSINFMLLHSDIHSDPTFYLFLAKMVFRPVFNYGFPICKDATRITGIILWNGILLQRSDADWIFRAFL
jgi:hypothetical protein